MVRPKRAPNTIKKALTTGSQSTTTDLNLNEEDSSTQPTTTTTHNKKTSHKKQAACEEILKEPRKRRMASLNAEFLVHYCSNSNNTNAANLNSTSNSSKRRRTISNESEVKKQQTKKESKSKRKTETTSESEQEKDEQVQVKVKPKQKTKSKAKQKAKKKHSETEEESNNSEEEERKVEINLTSGRPKREASMRASAMIIQTNEIEKTRFQYFSSATTTPANLISNNSNTNSKKETEKFQVPQSVPSMYKSKTANPKTKKQQAVEKQQELKHVSTTTTLANSTLNAGANNNSNNNLASQVEDEESSSDVLIVAEKSASKSNDLTLTEELLAEHNKLYGSYSTGNGAFSNHTRDYISKWAQEYAPTDEKPFPTDVIPIESYGLKVLNEPQYLLCKSRQQQNANNQPTSSSPVVNAHNKQTTSKLNTPTPVKNTKTQTATNKPTPAEANESTTKTSNDTKPVSGGSLNNLANALMQTKQKLNSPAQSTANQVSNNSSTPSAPQAQAQTASSAPTSTPFPFPIPSFDASTAQTTPWHFHAAAAAAAAAALTRPTSPNSMQHLNPCLRASEPLLWNNLPTNAESVNQLVAAAVNCSLSPMHLSNLSKTMSLPTLAPHNSTPATNNNNNNNTKQIPGSEFYPPDAAASYNISPFAKLKLKSEKLLDIRSHAAMAANSLMQTMPPMINVENVNFYGSLDEQQKAFFNSQLQDANCVNCPSSLLHHHHHHHHVNLNHPHHHHHHHHQTQTPAAAAAAAAAVAMNLAKFLSNPEVKKPNADTESIVSVSSSSYSCVKQQVKEEKQEIITQIKPECTDVNMIQEIDDQSSMSSSVHLIVDETSMIVESQPTQGEITKVAQVENAKLTEPDSNSNPSENTSQRVELNSNSNENTVSSSLALKETKEEEKKQTNSNWSLNSEPINSTSNKYTSIKNKNSNLIVNLEDFILLEKLSLNNNNNINNKTSKEVVEPNSVYNELINESSNTNYSIEENERSDLGEHVAQVKSIQFDSTRDKILISIRVYYKPEQIKNELKEIQIEDIKFEDRELIGALEENELQEIDLIKSKCTLLQYEKFKKSPNENEEANKELVYFNRYEIDLNKKEIKEIRTDTENNNNSNKKQETTETPETSTNQNIDTNNTSSIDTVKPNL